MDLAIEETLFAQAVQLAAGYMASGARDSVPGDDMREAVKIAYRALQEARQDIHDDVMQAPSSDSA